MRFLLLLGTFVSFGAYAEVADSAANGFSIKTTLTLNAPPAAVYEKFTAHVGEWWDSAHSYSGDAKNLTLDARPQGCFCEKIPGGGVVHMQVLNAMPGKLLVMSGAIGPLQSRAAAGTMTLTFTAVEGGTKLDVAYAVTGYYPSGLNTVAPMFDSVLMTQFKRFEAFAAK
jgi:uncharacterized protein YndB with AHSA1/START domain